MQENPQRDTMIGAPSTTQHLKTRLDSLRKMFDEDDSAKLRGESHGAANYFSSIPHQEIHMQHHEYDYDLKIPRNVSDHRQQRKGF